MPGPRSLAARAVRAAVARAHRTILSDPKNVFGLKNVFGFQNVAPIVKKSVIKSEGPVFEQTLNKVSALLTLDAIRKMNAAVELDKQSPSAVAHKFLVANHLS